MSKLRVNIIEPYSGSILNLSGSLYSSGQISASSFVGDGSGLTQISFTAISSKPTLVSGSSQISYPSISNIPSGIVSGSQQLANITIPGNLTIQNTIISNLYSGSGANLTNVTASAVYNVSGSGNTLLNFWAGTQTAYNAVSSSNALNSNTLYFIKA